MTKITIIEAIGEVSNTFIIETEDNDIIYEVLKKHDIIGDKKDKEEVKIVSIGSDVDSYEDYRKKLDEAIEQVKQDENKKKWEAHLDKCTPTTYEEIPYWLRPDFKFNIS